MTRLIADSHIPTPNNAIHQNLQNFPYNFILSTEADNNREATDYFMNAASPSCP
jgi:hypothetical protein